MTKYLATLIASLALGAVPVAAETAKQSNLDTGKPSVWLVLALGNGLNSSSLLRLPMKSLDQCEEQDAIYISSQRIAKYEYRGFECLEGK